MGEAHANTAFTQGDLSPTQHSIDEVQTGCPVKPLTHLETPNNVTVDSKVLHRVGENLRKPKFEA